MVTGFPPASSATPARHRVLALAACLGLALLCLGSPVALAGTIKYTYDDLGRLIAVDDGAGNFSIYIFDPVGNMVQILRPTLPDPAAPVGVAGFTPTRGAAGNTVTIFGKGFSPTPAQNEVRFNGLLATAVASSPTQLTTAAPAGATTGPISVRVGANTGTSAQAFVVLVAPTVTPPSAALFPRQVQTFTATQPSQWRVNNQVGGSATLGTITVTGTTATYTAPAAPPPNGVVTITAANAQDFTLQATATVEILPPPTADPLRSSPVSVARAPGAPTGTLPAPLVSVARALPALAAAPLAAPLVSAARAPAALSANPLEGPLVSVTRALPSLAATPLTAPLLAAARQPVVTAVQDPATGQAARFPRGTTNQNVRVLGAGFAGASAVGFYLATLDTNITVNSFTADSPTQITANISIASGAAVGFRVARVTASGVTSSPQGTSGNLLEVLP